MDRAQHRLDHPPRFGPGRHLAALDRPLDYDARVGDCERLDLPDAGFDTVSSICGVMFAPDHAATARELARVTHPGGSLALANWTPAGGVARMFAMMAPFQPAPPPRSRFDWGDEQRVRALLGEWFELELETHISTLRVPSGEDYWELFSTNFGPTKTLADSLGARRDELHRAWVEFFESNYRDGREIAHTRSAQRHRIIGCLTPRARACRRLRPA